MLLAHYTSSLTTLYLDESRCWQYMDYDRFRQFARASPALTHLVITGAAVLGQWHPPAILLPSLRTLSVASNPKGFLARLLLAIDAPQLASVAIRGRRGSDIPEAHH